MNLINGAVGAMNFFEVNNLFESLFAASSVLKSFAI